ncbi:MAG: hypothetical protein AB1668_06705 [Nanoarchaeota archaeon]
MNCKFKESVDRAIKLLETPPDYTDYVVFKIKPTVGGCCCFHCWPHTWKDVNQFIIPCGPLEDEGDVLIDKDVDKFVLECHESGPEIVVYMGVVTASILLVKSIIELITVLLKRTEKEDKKKKTDFGVFYYLRTKDGIEEKKLLEINLPLGEKAIKNLHNKIRKIINKK